MHGFDDILGQDSVIAHIRSAISERKVSHAYIICGESGFGKTLMAERFAAALVCTGNGERPCGSCIACMQSDSHNHPDIVYVTHEKTRIAVDDVRNQIISDIRIKPYSSEYKVYIVEDADKMNEQAQNALLKTLEEPPAYAVILLLAANTGAFLPTILSRCVTLTLKPVAPDLIRQYLIEKKEIPDYFANICASFAAGSVGKALRYASDDNFSAIRDDILDLVKRIDSMNHADINSFISGFSDSDVKKAAFPDYLNLLSLWYHDVLVFKATQDVNRLLFCEETALIRRQASEKSFAAINHILLSIEEASRRLNANVFFDSAVELLLLTMQEC